MKKKYIAALGTVLTLSAVAVGYASQNQSAGVVTNTATEARNTEVSSAKTEKLPKGRFDIVHGEVASIEEGTITINVGTPQKNGQGLSLTGETKEIEVSDDTMIRKLRGGMGPKGQKPDGQKPDGEPPEKPDDEEMNDGERPELPDFDGSARPEMGNRGGQKPEGEPPAKPDGDNDDFELDGEPPVKPDNQQVDGQNAAETLSLSDIKVGDEIAVFYDTDGTMKFIEIRDDEAVPAKPDKQKTDTNSDSEDTEDTQETEI